MGNLASTLWNQGRWEEAERLEVQVMETRKTKLGADHLSMLTSMGNLASTLWNQGRWEEAERLQVQVMETSKTKLGANHPDTLTSMNNLAFTWKMDAAGAQEPSPQVKLARSLLETGTAAFDPSSTKSSDETQKARAEFESIIERAGTWSLVQALNGLVKPNAAPAGLRKEAIDALVRIPLRCDGVRATLEFVFSVHPSGTLPQTGESKPDKRGANIAPEALAMATQILSSIPPAISDQTWIDAIAPQLLHLLDASEGPELGRVAGYVISFGILGRRRLGAPGSPGWNAFVNPILYPLKPSLNPNWRAELDRESDEAVDLTRDKVAVSAGSLLLSLRRLSALIHASPSPGVCKRLVGPVLLELWAIASWLNPPEAVKEKYCDVAASLLRMFLKIVSTQKDTDVLIRNLLYTGETNKEEGTVAWKYRLSGEDGLEMVVPRKLEHPPQIQDLEWSEVEQKSAALATTLVESCSDQDISTLFLQLFKRWVSSKSAVFAETIKTKIEDIDTKDPIGGLLEMVVLQQLMEKATDKLISKPGQLLDLICEVFEANNREAQGPEVISVTLSILNHVISAPQFQKSSLKSDVLKLINTSLDQLSRDGAPEVSQTARNLALLLTYRDDLEPAVATPPTDKQVEDRNAYKLAVSYIIDPESPPPVKSEGLNMISSLIQSNSPALDLPAVLVLLSKLLADSEDFINLRVIKMLVQLAGRHPKTVCQEILDHYLDAKETASTDLRLRFGEALVQVIERLGQAFTDSVATQVCEVLLSIASRRGHRPKTAIKQEREARQREKENKEAATAWGGEVPDMSDDVPEEEKMQNEILSRIVEGWESKRGSEDVRMRTSALSILATALETNISGVGPSLVSAGVDLCLFVLAFEPELEKGILRRAAIIYILGFARALDAARREGRRLGFGLTDESREDILRTLKYVEATDNDGLVQRHALDVIESLENLHMANLLHQNGGGGPAVERVVRMDPRLDVYGGGGRINSGPRPRIEEIDQLEQDDHYVGVDVGTGSARACIIDSTGTIKAIASEPIKMWKPQVGYYEQSTTDIWNCICTCVRRVLESSAVAPEKVKGIGFDATCSLAVFTHDTDEPVSVTGPDFANNDGADRNVILWLDHRPEHETEKINATGHNLLRYVGGTMNIEMEMPKVLWLKNNMPPELFARCKFYDLADALTHLATGSETRSFCSAICKQGYVPVGVDGSVKGWQEDFYRDIGLGELADDGFKMVGGVDRVNGKFLSAGELVGKLCEKASKDLGLPTTVAVGSGVIDAYAGWIGTVGVQIPELTDAGVGVDEVAQATTRLAAVAGTSTCHLVMSKEPVFVPGVWGPYRDVLVPGQWMAEGGQSATGELLRHVVESHPAYITGSAFPAGGLGKTSIYEHLNSRLTALAETSGAPFIAHLARHIFFYGDLWGNRSPIADPSMSGALVGMSSDTTADNLALMYYATMEFIAMQTRQIMQAMNLAGHGISSIFMSGGQCRNEILMGLMATVCGVPVVIPEYIGDAVVHGAAMLGAKAAGADAEGKTEDLWDIMKRMSKHGRVVWPRKDEGEKRLLDAKYDIFLEQCRTQREYRDKVDAALAGNGN
ncbi:related to D-ribulokinase [Cephalotrichum gorgonifer]|uniref:Related to D-ribulokinase n=1 Tax=Cephalotrichum gorgonifer TaxID=2041049 RepID=A0AAE8MZT4_9PEZI|nr:related to D-ribulokinase [Cephalotrichum gorgonifer]